LGGVFQEDASEGGRGGAGSGGGAQVFDVSDLGRRCRGGGRKDGGRKYLFKAAKIVGREGGKYSSKLGSAGLSEMGKSWD